MNHNIYIINVITTVTFIVDINIINIISVYHQRHHQLHHQCHHQHHQRTTPSSALTTVISQSPLTSLSINKLDHCRDWRSSEYSQPEQIQFYVIICNSSDLFVIRVTSSNNNAIHKCVNDHQIVL